MDEFMQLLLSDKRNPDIPKEDDFFGKLIGEWNFDMIADPDTETEHHVSGEWVFRRTLEGMAIQDIFICPARGKRQNGGEYGTTVRYYNKETRTWDVSYSCGMGTVQLEARKENDCIVLTEISKKHLKWTFSNITENTFQWTSTEEFDDKTKTYCIIYATRKNLDNVYEYCPQYENKKYLLRFISEKDCDDLLKVYSDKKAVPLFNSDNCNGDTFYYTTKERMEQAIAFWKTSYKDGWFVRWSIIDKTKNEVIGTIELFRRKSDDYFNGFGIMRLDLRSDYEKADEIENILSLIIKPSYSLFDCCTIATKAISIATERIIALEKLGFNLADKKLIGHDSTEYDSYFIKSAQA